MGKVINGDSYIDKSWFDDYDPLMNSLVDIEQHLNDMIEMLKNADNNLTSIEQMLNQSDNESNKISFKQRMFLLKKREKILKLVQDLLEESDKFLKQKKNIAVSLTIMDYEYSIREISKVIYDFLQENNIKDSKEIQTKYADMIIFLNDYIKEFEFTMLLFEKDPDIAKEFKVMIQQDRYDIQNLYLTVMSYRPVAHDYLNPTYRKFLKN